MTGVIGLGLASAAFVGTHFAMSHPLRAPMVKALGERGFGLVYIFVSFVTLYGVTRCYGPASAEAPAPCWDPGQAGWMFATILMWFGSILFVGSLRAIRPFRRAASRSPTSARRAACSPSPATR